MMKSLIAGFALALAACATPISIGQSPEQQIAIGAQAVTAATVLATDRLRDHRISVPQAKSYRNMLVAAGESLTDANGELLACRASTGSTARTAPDPCWPKVSDVVLIAVENITSVKKALEGK